MVRSPGERRKGARPQISRAFNYVPLTREVYRFPSRGTIESSLSISLYLSLSLTVSSSLFYFYFSYSYFSILSFFDIFANFNELQRPFDASLFFPLLPLPPLIPFLYLFLSPFFSISLDRPKKWGLRFGVFAK